MRAEPTVDEQEFYEANGFLSVAPFLDPGELEVWRRVVEEALARRDGKRMSFSDEDGVDIVTRSHSQEDQDYYDRVFTQRVNLWQTDDSLRELLFQDALGAFVEALAKVDGLRVWHDQALVKEPYANPTAFHLDVPYWSFTSPGAITIWIALDDATLENGCLYYLPGSHKAKKFDNVDIGKQIGALFDVYPEWRDAAAVPCPVPAGGALLHNGLTAHGAGANMTTRRRRAMTCAYMPDGATFNGQANVLPPGYLSTLRVGDVLDNEQQNPLVYRPRTASSDDS
jgi:ectoine hydroxylase-related dioxygenase (phytanoyl-CoA dioxygenase family)